MYSLLSTGLHGENGLDVETSLYLLKIYVLPVLLYGLEIILPPNKYLNQLEMFHKKTLKQILSVPQTTADPAVYIYTIRIPANQRTVTYQSVSITIFVIKMTQALKNGPLIVRQLSNQCIVRVGLLK